jgi:iron complex outermembrane recepter protein
MNRLVPAQFARILSAAILAPLSVSAQQVPPAPTGALEEVVVTAQKRATNLQDVPFSVASTSDEQIRNAGVGNIVDLARNVAGLTIADLGPGQSQISIRGISAGQVIRDQPGVKEQVGVYLDESPISVALFTPDLELFDLDRFEVLRGPQGTLFGAGSTSGTLRYITKQPKLGAFEGVVDGSLEDPTHGSVGGSLRAALNLPVGDTAAVRFVGYEHHLPGFIDAIQPGGSVKKGVNDGDRAGARIALLWKPTEQLSITPRLVYQSLSTNGYPRVDLYNILANPYTTTPTSPPVTIGDRQQYTQLREGISDDFGLTDLKLDYDLGAATLTSITSYTNRKLTVKRDATQLTGSITFGSVFHSEVPLVRTSSPLYDRTRLNAVSEELRIASNGNSTLDWLGGAFFQHVGRRYGQSLPTPGYDAAIGAPSSSFNNAPPDNPFYSDLVYRFKQYAAFGEATYHFTSQWALTGGLRWYKFNEDRLLNFGGVFVGPADPVQTANVAGSVDSNGVSPRAILTFKASEDAQFNLQASKGFRLGGINDPINRPLCQGTDIQTFGNQKNWKDETLWNYEIGTKLRFLDRRVTFNVSAFYADIKDLQATVTAGSCSSRLIFNVPKARSTGIEAEVFARPNSTWDFGLAATAVDAKLRSSVVDGNNNVLGGLQSGNQMPTAPKFQAVGSVGYSVPLAQSRDFFANLTVQYVGGSYSQFENEGPNFGLISSNPAAINGGAAALIPLGNPTITQFAFNPQLPSYSLGNLRAGVRTDRWEVAGYVNNLWDETARLALDYERGRRARVGYLTNQPRTVGVSARFNF